MFGKIKNFFKSNKNSTSSKALDTLSNGLTIDTLKRYKNLIPNLLDEFLDKKNMDQIRSNSFTKKNIKLTLSENKLVHSNSQLLLKLKKKETPKQANIRVSIGRHYFLGSISQDSKHMTTKDVRRGSYQVKKSDIILEKKEENNDNVNEGENINNNNIAIKRNPKKKKTIDPQDTIEANHIEFKISAENIDINETKEKLEEYQEKMRKTQLRFYVFKKITNYKSYLRRCFQKYRSTVQLMGALEEKKEENKQDEETQKKKIKLLKNILKNRSFKEQKELNKYLLRFYYNCKYAAGIANLSKIFNKNKDKNKVENENKDQSKNENKIETKNEEINTNENNAKNENDNDSNFLNVIKEEIKKEEEKKEEEKKELTEEEIEKARRKRNKELRDLFYNKVRERQKWLHDHFVKFYYKGLLWAMKTGNIRNNTSSPSETKTETKPETNNTNVNPNSNPVVENNTTTNNSTDNNLNNKPSSEIDTININKEIEKKEEEKKDEDKKEEEKKDKKKAFNKIRDRSKGLRKLLSEKNKEKTNILRKYFFKFLSNGILLSLKKTTLKSSKTLTKIIDTEQTEGGDAKKEEEESNWIIEEKKRRKEEEEKRQKELMEKKIKILFKIFTKKDQILCGKERSCLQKWNLRAKIIAIGDLTTGFRKSKKGKGKKKIKKKDGKNKEKKENDVNDNEEKEEKKEV